MIPFLLSPIGRYVIIAVAALSAIAGEYAYLRVHYYNAGHTAAINEIAAKNKEATDAVTKAIASVEECNARGRTWNTVDGMCE